MIVSPRVFVSVCCLLVVALGGPAAGAVEPAAVLDELRAAGLDPDRAVAVEGLNLDAGLATLRLERGVLVPAAPVAGRPVEMVFLGEGHLELEPPDDIEAAQLELFTGAERLDAAVEQAVFVLANDGAVEALLARPSVEGLDEERLGQAQRAYRSWRDSPERKLLDVEASIVLDALGDPGYGSFFAGRFESEELGQFLYLEEPEATEQITLGRFEPFDLTEREQRKARREIHRQQRRGRLMGLELQDLGLWDTWLSAARTGASDEPMPGAASFEPVRYTLDVRLEGRQLELDGTSRMDLEAMHGGARGIRITLPRDLEATAVRDSAGAALFFHREGDSLLVVLPAAPAAGEGVTLEVDYAGRPFTRVDSKSFVLPDSLGWYPRVGTDDQATYDVTIRHPRQLDLVAMGELVDEGGNGGERWQRRVMELPTFGFGFEVGSYKTVRRQVGDVEIVFAYDYLTDSSIGLRENAVLDVVADALVYFENLLGPYPHDRLTVTTAHRGYSQSLRGFITLASTMLDDSSYFSFLFEDPRAVIAHEVAHQWWGHRVGFETYRDYWITEAMASYTALLYSRNELGIRTARGPTAYWQEALTFPLEDGRDLESVGPVVLGSRLDSSRARGAYEAIVYRKGAVVLDMLAKTWGEETFIEVMKRLVAAVDGQRISTEDFFRLISQATGTDLTAFTDQFVYSTGLPKVYYDYRFEETEPGRWKIQGTARQASPWRYEYRVEALPNGGFDVARSGVHEVDVERSTLVVPIQLTVYDPETDDRPRRKRDGPTPNKQLTTVLLVQGPETTIEIEVPFQPVELYLDPDEEVFARFFNQRRWPKQEAYSRGLNLAAAGDLEAAVAANREALGAPVYAGTEERDEKALREQARWTDLQIQMSLARVLLERRDPSGAERAVEAARDLEKNDDPRWLGRDLRILEARAALQRGDFDTAYDLVRERFARSAVSGREGTVVLAIAAHQLGRADDYEEAAQQAEKGGADLTALGEMP